MKTFIIHLLKELQKCQNRANSNDVVDETVGMLLMTGMLPLGSEHQINIKVRLGLKDCHKNIHLRAKQTHLSKIETKNSFFEKDYSIFLKMLNYRPLFLYFCFFYISVYLIDNIFPMSWFQPNRGSLAAEPQPLPNGLNLSEGWFSNIGKLPRFEIPNRCAKEKLIDF